MKCMSQIAFMGGGEHPSLILYRNKEQSRPDPRSDIPSNHTTQRMARPRPKIPAVPPLNLPLGCRSILEMRTA